MGLSRGNLDASRQGAKGTSCRTARGSRASGNEVWVHKEPATELYPVTAAGLQEAGERNEAVHLNLLQATELRVAGYGLHFFFSSAQVCAATEEQLNPTVSPGVTLDKTSEDYMSRCLFFSWLA